MNSIFVKESGAIRHFVTQHFEQAAFGSKNLDKRLKFCMQPSTENLGSEVIDLH